MSDIKDIWVYANNIIRSSRQMVNEGLKPLGLSSAEGNILLHLLTQDLKLRQEDLVAQLDISKPAVSRALESLESKGYVSREKDPEDRRVSRVTLTGKARDIGSQVEEAYNRVFSVATHLVSEGEVRDFIELFGRVSHSFTAARANKEDEGGQG